MSVNAVQRDEATATFFDFANRGEFLVHVCGNCGTVAGPQQASCPACRSTDLDEGTGRGQATLVSWTVAHTRRPHGGPDDVTVLAIGQLAEGPWWWTQLLDADPSDLRLGQPLRIDYERPDGSEAVPVFRIAKEVS